LGGGKCSPRAKESGELECEENVSVMKIDDSGGSDDAPATLELAPGRLGSSAYCRTRSVSPWRTKRERKKGGGGSPSPAAADEQRRRQW
jgi:hypothetical protein